MLSGNYYKNILQISNSEFHFYRILTLEHCESTMKSYRDSCPHVEKSLPIHICGTSQAGDVCSGDTGGALATGDTDNK